MTPRLVPLPGGVRLKFRIDEHGALVASAWMEAQLIGEVARLEQGAIPPEAGDPLLMMEPTEATVLAIRALLEGGPRDG